MNKGKDVKNGGTRMEGGVIKSPPTISPTGSSVLLTLVDYLSGRGKQEGRSKRGKQN